MIKPNVDIKNIIIKNNIGNITKNGMIYKIGIKAITPMIANANIIGWSVIFIVSCVISITYCNF